MTKRRVRRAVVIVASALHVSIAWTSASFCEDALRAHDVLNALDARRSALRTIQAETEWETGRDGVLDRWESQSRSSDEYGRIRVRSRRGGYDARGQRHPDSPAETDEVYTGQATISLAWYPDWDAQRGLPPEMLPPGAQATWGYFAAQIHAGPWPAPYGPRQLRDPLTFIENDLRFGLEAAMDAGRELVEVSPQSDGVCVVRLTAPDGLTGRELEFEASIDAKRGWIVLATRARDDDSQLVLAGDCDYFFDDESGLWLPLSGRLRRWPHGRDESDVPAKETRFTVNSMRVNDPAFPEDAFTVLLPVGTAVSDLRFGVNYRIGETARDDAELTKLAASALATAPTAISVDRANRTVRSSPRRVLLLAGNLVMLAAVISWVVYSSHSSRLNAVSQ